MPYRNLSAIFRTENSMKVETHPGKLPPFWSDRSVVFIANLLALFFGNKAQTELLFQEIKGAASYGGRLIPVLDLIFRNRDNLLVLERAPEPGLLEYFRGELELTLPRVAILPHSEYCHLADHVKPGSESEDAAFPALAEMRSHPALWLDGFVTDGRLADLARGIGKRTISTESGSREGNNKAHLHRFLEEVQLPVFDTEWAEAPGDVPSCLRRLGDSGYTKAVLKSGIGASGIGILKLAIDSPTPPDEIPEHLFYEGTCLVQGWLDDRVSGVAAIHSPSVQVFVGEDRVHLYDLTEQILSPGSVHEGNCAPPPYLKEAPELREEILAQAGRVADWLHSLGYRGTASVDLHVACRRSGFDVRVCELNARVTGATYPSVLARHFQPRGAWIMRNLRLTDPHPGPSLLRRLRRAGVLFKAGRESGILPINFILAESGLVNKGQFLALAPTLAECQSLLSAATDALAMPFAYDRD